MRPREAIAQIGVGISPQPAFCLPNLRTKPTFDAPSDANPRVEVRVPSSPQVRSFFLVAGPLRDLLSRGHAPINSSGDQPAVDGRAVDSASLVSSIGGSAWDCPGNKVRSHREQSAGFS